MPTLAEMCPPPGAVPELNVNAPKVRLFGGAQWEPVTMSRELQRVASLPRREPVKRGTLTSAAIVAEITERYSKHIPSNECRCGELDPRIAKGLRTCITEPMSEQAWALREIGMYAGCLGALPVGIGKTFLDVMAPMSLARAGVKRSLLLVPSGLITQLLDDYELIQQHFHVPSLSLHDGTNRYRPSSPNAPHLDVLPYERLQTEGFSEWINNRAPEAIIADECDNLTDPRTARTSRVVRYFAKHGDTRFCGWTGSLTDDSIENYWILAAFALRELSPLPHDVDIVREWARAIDPSESPADEGALRCLYGPEDETLWDAWYRRLSETPGVIIGTAQSSTAEMVITMREPPPLPPKIVEALAKVRASKRPDTMAGSKFDADLNDALEVAKYATEVACGMFYRWVYPPVVRDAKGKLKIDKRRGRPQEESLVDEWHLKRKAYFAEEREALQNRQDNFDSPYLLQRAADRYYGLELPPEDPQERARWERLPVWPSIHWRDWRAIQDEIAYETEAVRIDDYLVQDAAQWATENRGIVWYDTVEFGKWLSEVSGLPMFGGGTKTPKLLKKEVGDRSIICSIESHGRGRNGLQLIFGDKDTPAKQLVAQPPASNKRWEQLLGRLARHGQRASRVETELYAHTPELRKAVDQALLRSDYVGATLRTPQKLRAGWQGG